MFFGILAHPPNIEQPYFLSRNHGFGTYWYHLGIFRWCLIMGFIQWPFQEPKLEVPTIYTAYFLGLNFREYHHKIWSYVVQYLHFRILNFPIEYWYNTIKYNIITNTTLYHHCTI